MSYVAVGTPFGADPPPGYSLTGKFPGCWPGQITGGSTPLSYKLLAALGYDTSTGAKAEKSIMEFVKMRTGGYKIPPDPWFCETLWSTWESLFAPELAVSPAQMIDPSLLAAPGDSYIPVLGPDKQKPPWMLGIGACPRPMVGTPPNCKIPIVRGACPPGMVGKPPYCTFPSGTLDPTFKPKPTRNVCTSPYVGVWPNCKLPEGQKPHEAWAPPCPPGYVGTPPDCQLGPTTKLKCPTGYQLVEGTDTCIEGEPEVKPPPPPPLPPLPPPPPPPPEGWSIGAKVAVGVAVAAGIGLVGLAVYKANK